jgi:hypothetical protein
LGLKRGYGRLGEVILPTLSVTGGEYSPLPRRPELENPVQKRFIFQGMVQFSKSEKEIVKGGSEMVQF